MTPTVRGQTRPARLPAPEASVQAKSLQLIRTLFKEEYARKSAADRVALAARLYKEASATNDDLNARYVLWLEAQELAAGGGDSELAIQAIEELGKTHVVDSLNLKHKALLRASLLTQPPSTCESFTNLALGVADAAAIADSFDMVASLCSLAEAAANKTKRVAFVASIQSRLGDLRALAAEYAKVQLARAKLQGDPDDAAAHLLIGRFYCFNKNEFVTGLPHLARGSDGTLKALAQRDTAQPQEALTQVEIGDAWWEYAQLTGGAVKLRATQRAQYWYAIATDNIKGITLTRIQSRMKNAEPAAGAPTKPSDSPVVTGTNLLTLLDLSRDVVAGKWQIVAAAISSDSSKYARVEIPLIAPEEYDLQVTFTRVEGEGYIAILLQSHGEAFGLALDVKGEARLERVAGRINASNPTTVPILLHNDKKQNVLVQVRKDKIAVLLNEKPLLEWKTDGKDLSRYSLWKLNDEKLLGLGAHNARVIFHSATLVAMTGKAKASR